MSTLQRLAEKGLVKPPRWLPRNVVYETIMGSVAYGVSGDSSDMDVAGFAIPPKEDVFPHLRGEWSLERLQAWCAEKESQLERACAESRLRPLPDEEGLRRLLLECLEAHYGSLAACVEDPDRAVAALKAVQTELDRVRDLL